MTDLNLKFITGRLEGNRLLEEYLAATPEACRFYGGHFAASDRLEKRAAEVDRRLDRQRAAAVLSSQRTFALVKNGGRRIAGFLEKRGFITTTGQQPVLFGVPLYIIYKCLTAIRMAAYAEQALGVPVLPVFWNASEDHDLAEAASLSLPNLNNELESLSVPAEAINNRPLCQVEVGPEVEALLTRFQEISPETEFRPWITGLLGTAYTRDRDLGLAFSTFIAALFADQGLFVVDACHPSIREGSRELFEREIFRAGESRLVIEQTSAELARSGYPLQIAIQPEDTSLFLIREGRREKLQTTGNENEFRLKASGDLIQAGELRRILENHPVSFSPGVMLRPLVEAHLFGSLCYAAGPGEISYYAQMGGLYELHGLGMPLIRPRLSGILLEHKIGRILEKYGLGAGDFRQGADALSGRLLGREGPTARLIAELGELRGQSAAALGRIRELALSADPTLAGPVSATSEALASSLSRLENRITAAAKKQNEVLISQLGKAAVHLRPRGKPQERELAGIYYLVRYGAKLIDFLYEQAGVETD